MKRLLWKVVMLVVVLVPCSYADSFRITQVMASMEPRTGNSGDNLFFTFTGPGTTFQASGMMQCYPWCYNDQELLPTPSAGSIGDIYVTAGSYGPAMIGGKTYSVVSYDPASFFGPEGVLNSSVVVLVDQGGVQKEIELALPENGGAWNFHFNYIPAHDDYSGGYVFSHGEFYAASPPTPVPEPGTLGLMATGLAGITSLIRRKRLISGRRPN